MGKVTGANNTKKAIAKRVGKITSEMTERTVNEVLILGMAASDAITPVDTSNLINSKFRKVSGHAKGYTGQAGYTSAYAKYIHDATGKLKGQPRPNGQGVFWGPDGEPRFLVKGFERDAKDDIKRAIKRGYK